MSGGTCLCDDKWLPASDLESLWGPFLRPFASRKGKGRRKNFHSGRQRTSTVEPGAPRRGAALRRMSTRKTATDVQHHTICHILETTRCATATAVASTAGTRMMTIGFVRGSGLPVSSKTSSTIDSQIQSQSTLNATAEHAEQIETNHPMVY